MKALLKRWLGKDAPGDAHAKPFTQASIQPAPPLTWREGTTLPIVDWPAMDRLAPMTGDGQSLDFFWTAAARAWLEALQAALGKPYAIHESDRFLLLGPQQTSRARVVLDYAEKTRRRVVHLLDGIAKESEIGKVCVLIFDGDERYYEYVSHYYPDDGEFSISGGMFLQHGYGHFVFVDTEMHMMEPTIAHELTHCLLQHLPLPAWLNEGLAVNTEQRLSPPAGRPLYTVDEMQEKHLQFWNTRTIQEFWSGKSWLRPDEANMLSYDLAKHFVMLAAADIKTFGAFANAADAADGGDRAASEHLGYALKHLAEAVLGEGSWEPRPETWVQGVETGQF